MAAAHPLTRRWYAEDLIRLRRPGEQRRYFASQRAGRVDPNPHQIDAVVFALRRIPEGGCILADEVGLGKTIEAGLVIAQLRAEGAGRILLITPKPLLGQWREELWALFGIETREGTRDGGVEGPGVVLVGREFAGSEAGSAMLLASGKFDLAIIDEAHEIFAGLYRRFDRHGQLGTSSRYAKTAARVKAVLADTPVLLLTATPIQNALTELWGLVQYVEPTGTLLGDLPTFRTMFCEGDDRRLRAGRDDELRRRIAAVCQRTLRRQAEAFMQRKFVRRSARLFTYTMTPDEKALYEDVTAYLMRPDLVAFGGGNRRLLLLSFHRRMASSLRALADSLDAVLARLRKRATSPTLDLFRADLEDDELEDAAPEPAPPASDAASPVAEDRLLAEIDEVRRLAERARALPVDSKAEQLVVAVRHALERGRTGQGSGKLVLFTEAISTQDYLVEVLCASGVLTRGEITVFRGQNTGARVQEAEARWEEEVGRHLPIAARPSPDVTRRLALVHEFATRTPVFLSTEAGAKGLNLQFCETVVNYDLPWNPQRIEQRIGRCHRYGQTRDVTVINFLARDNEAQRLTFELLSRKLELFGTVLDASDVVLHESTEASPGRLLSALGGDFEAELQRVYAQSRSPDELALALADLDEEMGERRRLVEESHMRTAGLIESRLDETVRAAFRRLEGEAPQALREFDRELEGVLVRYLEASGRAYRSHADDERTWFDIAESAHESGAAALPTRVVVGAAASDDAEPLHLGHPLIRAAVDETRRATRRRFRVAVRREDLGAAFSAWPAGRGRLVVLAITYGGYEPTVELLPVAVVADDPRPWSRSEAQALVVAPLRDLGEPGEAQPELEERLQEAIEEALFLAQADVDAREQERFQAAMDRIERHMEDRIAVVRRAQAERLERLKEAQQRRAVVSGALARTAAEEECAELQEEIDRDEAELERLRRRDDPQYVEWRMRAHERRYTVPRWETILDAEFELA